MPEIKTPKPTWRGHFAGFASRVSGILIDFLVLAVIISVVSQLYNTFFVNLLSFWDVILKQNKLTMPSLSLGFTIVMITLSAAIYFILFWTILGASIGGLVMGTKIVNRYGKHPSLWQSFLRWLFEIGFIPLGIFGSLWILLDRRRRALFDIIAGTYVIYSWDAQPDEIFLKQATDKITSAKNEEGEQG
jgi:uncharacterized RDD family membrane protein YckC